MSFSECKKFYLDIVASPSLSHRHTSDKRKLEDELLLSLQLHICTHLSARKRREEYIRRFLVIRDQWGSKNYYVKSNLVFNVFCICLKCLWNGTWPQRTEIMLIAIEPLCVNYCQCLSQLWNRFAKKMFITYNKNHIYWFNVPTVMYL